MLKKKHENHVKFMVINKETDEIHLIRFQKDVSWLVGVSERTLRRHKYYENSKFKVYFNPIVLSAEEKVSISGQKE